MKMQRTTVEDEPLIEEYAQKLYDVLYEGKEQGLSFAAGMNSLAQVIGILMAINYSKHKNRKTALKSTFDLALKYAVMWEGRMNEFKNEKAGDTIR